MIILGPHQGGYRREPRSTCAPIQELTRIEEEKRKRAAEAGDKEAEEMHRERKEKS